MRCAAIANLDATAYRRHSLHGEQLAWVEKNCYVDIWIEVLNSLELEPVAMLPFTAFIDFEGDQWTFFKPPHGELYDLYGVDVQELALWKPLLEHVEEHVAAGRLISVEADAFWLPDTAGTDYRRNHVKTTIAINAMDQEAQSLDYFHNAGYHRLCGDDFRSLFRMDVPPDPAYLPLFAEFIRIERRRQQAPGRLAVESRQLLARHFARRPLRNPIEKFAVRFAADLSRMQDKGLAYYHLWAFANLRQLGAAFELASINLRWLGEQGALVTERAAQDFELISGTCKSLVLKGARAVNSRREMDIHTPCVAMAEAWNQGMADLAKSLHAEL